jgi:hypothetical protein
MPPGFPEKVITPDSPAIFLEIAGRGEEGSARFPVTIKTVAGRVATLEVGSPWRLAGCETLTGHRGHLRLTPWENDEPLAVEGTVAWARFGGQERCRLQLGLELANPDPAIQRLLEDYVAHTPKDIKELWNRWDEVHETSKVRPLGRKLYLAGLSLMLAGLVLQLPGPKAYKFVGWILWFLGSLGVISKYLGPLKTTD